jgi:hypothetical protein
MNDEFYKDKIELLVQKHKHVSRSLLQLKFKIGLEEAKRLHKLFVEKPIPIDNFPKQKHQKTLIKKHGCKAVSVPYLQKRLGLSWKETEELLNEWRNITKPSDVYRKKFSEISKYLNPPKFEREPESLSELQKKKERRTINAIRFLESIGYTVEKK